VGSKRGIVSAFGAGDDPFRSVNPGLIFITLPDYRWAGERNDQGQRT
jgi:hypothetical protein